MKTKLVYTAFLFLLLTSSCGETVKKTSEAGTKLVGKAISGVNEAIKEDDGKLAEESTDAAGTVIKGAGRSIDKHLEENTESVFTTAGRTLVQAIDGTLDGMSQELEKVAYDTLTYVSALPDDIKLTFLGRNRQSNVIDSYFVMGENKLYKISFDAYDSQNNIIVSRDLELSKSEGDRRTITFGTFTLSHEDIRVIKQVKYFKVYGKEIEIKN